MSSPARADTFAFIRDKVNTYEKVHVLTRLFAWRAWCTPHELAESSGVPIPIIDDAQEQLVERGLLVRHEYEDAFLYAAGDSDRDERVSALCELNDHDPLELARQLNAAALERARNALDARLLSAFAPRTTHRARRP
jgi:hypothetical protein